MPDDAVAHNNLGTTLYALGRLDEAETCYRRALQIKPNYAEPHNNLGTILNALGRLDEAEASYRNALQNKPDFADAHCNLGLTLMKLGRLDEAITQFERTMALAPKLNSAKFGLCQALYELNCVNGEKAKRLAYRAREIYPDDPIVLRGTSGILGETRIATDETIYTRELFNGFARTFESTLESLDYSIPKRLANELGLGRGEVGNSLDVLDAGCGTGLCGAYLRPVARTLVGVDLSSEMLRLAKEKNLYDALHEGGIDDFLQQNVSAFDLIVFADVLIYFGDLRNLFESSSRSLRQDGIIAISAECMEHEEPSDTYALQPSGRYRHSTGYIKRLFEDAGFSIEKTTLCTLRMEFKKPISGCIVIARNCNP
jgi:predicted TPR repeat methyltransferase